MPNKLIQFINTAYELGIVKASVLRDGSDNTVWLLEGKDKEKFVARVSKRQMESDIAFEAEWLRFLKSKKAPVVPIVENKVKKPYATLSDGHAITVFEFVFGRHQVFNLNTPPALKAASSAARALALLHNTSRGHRVPLPRHRTIYTELERAIAHEKEIMEKVSGGPEFLKVVKEYAELKPTSKPVLVHNDYRVNNVLFDERKNVSAILDFDWSCVGPAIKDVGHALAEWSYQDEAKTHWENVFNAFLENYNKEANEKIKAGKSLYDWIAFSCLSDTCTYLVDRLECGEVKPVESSYMYRKFLYFRKQLS